MARKHKRRKPLTPGLKKQLLKALADAETHRPLVDMMHEIGKQLGERKLRAN